jgi:hypothetical protein
MSTAPAPAAKPLHYRDVRGDIADGDLFLFRGNMRSSRLFERGDHSYYSHVAVVHWWADRLMILQAEAPGIQAVPLSACIQEYPGRADWYRLRRDAIDPERLKRVLWEAKAELGLPYGVRDLIRSLLYWGFRVKLPNNDRPRAMFCAEYVEWCFQAGGMPLCNLPPIATMPKHCAASPLIEYAGTIIHTPGAVRNRDADRISAAAGG